MNKTVIPSGSEACGCCEGIAARTPQGIDNRPGLSAIAYRIGEYAQFRDSMLAGLSSSSDREPAGEITTAAAYPLANLRSRDTDDFTIGLIDAVACAADVLTFYQERVANESYLRTATERVSLQEMARLIGYRLRPGVAAETWLAFALETPRTPPPGGSRDPGAFVTGIPASLTLPVGLKVQSVPGPDEKPQLFETLEQVTARPEWNAIRPWLSAPHGPGLGATDTWVEGITNNLEAGDALVFIYPDSLAHPTPNTDWDFRLIDTVAVDAAANRTHLTWIGGLATVSTEHDPAVPPQVYVFRKRVAVFGHNAPMWKSMSDSFRQDYPKDDGDTKDRPDWPHFTISPAHGDDLDLDSVYDGISPGGLVILTGVWFGLDLEEPLPDARTAAGIIDAVVRPPRQIVRVFTVINTTVVSRAEFALAGRVTRLALAGIDLNAFVDHPRDTTVYAQSERVTLAPYPVTEPIAGDRLPLVMAAGLVAGQRVIVTGQQVRDGKTPVDGTTVAHRATLTGVESNGLGSVLTISPRLPFALKRDTVVVHANIALATHGETGAQILGSGDAARTFQRFELSRTPLTYRSATNETGAASELTVRVGDVEWSERQTLFGAGPRDRVYALNTDEQGRTFVVFGDGVHGARLPSGVIVRASYRRGLGQDGNVRADALTQLAARPLGLKSVSNPVPAQGGSDPEAGDQARRTMPQGTRTLGRAVSLLDYEDFALAFTGVAKARAQVLQLPGGPTIAMTLAGQDGAALSAANPVWNNLWLALRANGDPHVRVTLLSYQPQTFYLGLKVKRDRAYELTPLLAAVEAALRAHYSFASRSLGQPVLQSDVIAVAHSVPGVVAVDLDVLCSSPADRADRSLQTRLLASPMRVSGGVALPMELLTLDPAAFDPFQELT